ncbi:hypothetical protein [Massilia consociata]|uniref:Lipoprotein n=1 Tax=Massilia consociata TaxID=760117 RepID=A0ABV6FH96_9BURK
MRMSKVVMCILALGLAACSTPQERAARMQAEMAQLMTVYGPACSQLGYPQNSDQWRNCVLQLSTREELRQIGNAPAVYGGWGSRRWHGGYWGPYW